MYRTVNIGLYSQGRGESVAIGGVSCQNDQVATAKLTNFYLFNAENVTKTAIISKRRNLPVHQF